VGADIIFSLFLSQAVHNNGFALEHAASPLREDRELVCFRVMKGRGGGKGAPKGYFSLPPRPEHTNSEMCSCIRNLPGSGSGAAKWVGVGARVGANSKRQKRRADRLVIDGGRSTPICVSGALRID